MNRFAAFAAATALFVGGSVTATEDVADMQARIAALEAKMMAPAASGDAESLTSMKKKGQIKIGGESKITLSFTHADERDYGRTAAGAQMDDVKGGDTLNYTNWTWEAALKFKVEANADTTMFMKLDLEDADDADDLVEEVGIHFKNVRGSNWDIIVGKDEMPFGQDCCRLITDGFVHGGSSILAGGFGGAVDGAAVTNTNPHAAIGLTAADDWGGEIDNAVGVQAHYKFKDLAKLELALFQNPDAGNSRAVNMFEDKSEDQFQSYATRLWVYPVENLKTQISYSNKHRESMDDEQGSNDDRNANEHALSVSFAYNWKPMKLDFYGEYIYNWNMDYRDGMSADIWQLGVGYKLTKAISLQGWWEMVRIDNNYEELANTAWGSNNQVTIHDDVDERYQRIGFGATYKTDCGVSFIGEYLYEWYENDLSWYSDADAHQVSFRTEYKF